MDRNKHHECDVDSWAKSWNDQGQDRNHHEEMFHTCAIKEAYRWDYWHDRKKKSFRRNIIQESFKTDDNRELSNDTKYDRNNFWFVNLSEDHESQNIFCNTIEQLLVREQKLIKFDSYSKLNNRISKQVLFSLSID